MTRHSKEELVTSGETTETGDSTKDEVDQEENQNVNEDKTTDSTGASSTATKKNRKKSSKKRRAAAARKAAAEAEEARKKQMEAEAKNTKDSTTDTCENEARKSTSVNGSGSNTKEPKSSYYALQDQDEYEGPIKGGYVYNSKFEHIPESSVPFEIQAQLKRQILAMNKHNPEVKKILEGNQGQVSYGVLDLNDLDSFPSLSQANKITPKEKKSTTPVPTMKGKSKQDITKGPNSEPPAGYPVLPPPGKCRDLTEEQIKEEVRKMYAFPFEEEGDEVWESWNRKKDSDISENSDAKAKGGVNSNFLAGTKDPNGSGAGSTGKHGKETAMGSGVRKEMHDKQKPVGGLKVEPKIPSQPTNVSRKGTTEKKVDLSSSAFPLLEFNMISPNDPNAIQRRPAATTIAPSSSKTITTTTASAKSKLNPNQDLIPPPTQATLNASVLNSSAKVSTPKRVTFKEGATVMSQTSPRSHPNISPAATTPPSTIVSDLTKIIQGMNLPPEDAEKLIKDLNEGDGAFLDFNFLLEADIEGKLVDSLKELELDPIIDVGEKEKELESLRTEKRECERKLREVEEELLLQKHQNEALVSALKKRNMTLVQITTTFNRFCTEWNMFDQENTQQDQDHQLGNDQAESFKDKVCEVNKLMEEALRMLNDENVRLEVSMNEKLQAEIENLKSERNATIGILRETKNKLDESKKSLRNVETELLELRKKSEKNSRKYEGLLQQKTQLEKNYFDAMERKEGLEAIVKTLTAELSAERSAKAKNQIAQDDREAILKRTRAESEMLHEYYNRKLREILKSEREEVAKAKGALREQIKNEAMESVKKLSECEEKHQREIETLKAEHIKEIVKLKREVEVLKGEHTSEMEKLKKEIEALKSEDTTEMEKLKREIEALKAEHTTEIEKLKREIEARKAEHSTEIEKLEREILQRKILISSAVKQLQMSESSTLDLTGLTDLHSQLQKDLGVSLKPESPFQPRPLPSSTTLFTLDTVPVAVSKTTKDGDQSFILDNPFSKSPFDFKTPTTEQPSQQGCTKGKNFGKGIWSSLGSSKAGRKRPKK